MRPGMTLMQVMDIKMDHDQISHEHSTTRAPLNALLTFARGGDWCPSPPLRHSKDSYESFETDILFLKRQGSNKMASMEEK